jgi:hypothetical protein
MLHDRYRHVLNYDSVAYDYFSMVSQLGPPKLLKLLSRSSYFCDLGGGGPDKGRILAEILPTLRYSFGA